ncbi:putative DNA-binding protein with PD1-like DNA-binding motif [Elusimicrobium minutum Pei191]|uniref:Putative DNA-binding protein with PD1-like DNA-binding motif n=1 Tax=Elusimicrobium minutum (strain Pei191) TaxID=445932 RepID=B2KB93_ELUMP|nr:PPC domain-containing DNA-binding protein [Elusimicrobium minutum]ACC97915.1 putative DNA-binding protein with PD1-like DNA-binding motif [Elusimicrobium minutum Pei191]
MAEEKPYLTGRTYIFRLPKGKDLQDSITAFCHDNQIKCGIINAIGAVENATVSYYDQAKKKYEKIVLEDEHELVSLIGNVSIKDNRPFVHAHAILSNKKGEVKAGHLMLGTKIFSAEVYIQELVGEPKVRKEDKVTKLQLWA